MENVAHLRVATNGGVPLERFTKTVGPTRGDESCLVPWHDDILRLRALKYTLRQVREFLAANGVEISENGISMYLRRWLARKQVEPLSAETSPLPSIRTRRNVRTHGSKLTSAEICRRNDWHPGTLLAGENAHGIAVIRLTAIGDQEVLARHIAQNGEPVSELAGREVVWTLTKRDWREVRDSKAL